MIRSAIVGLLVSGCGWLVPAALAAPADSAMPNPFFAYCVGIGVGNKNLATLPAQRELVPMLADLGYVGMAHVGMDGTEEMLEALEGSGQKLVAAYTPLSIDPDTPAYDPKLDALLPKLAGHGTVVWLVINSKKYKPSSTDGDDRAVELVRKIADAARPYGISLSLYPHQGCYAQRIEDVVRVVQKADRPNVGVTFTFCHFLAVDEAKNLDRALALARPYLNMVTINGTSGFDPKNHAGWILPLDQGTFDVAQVLRTLHKLDYRGPIGLIAYGIKGDRREILARSIKAWRELAAKAAEGDASPAAGK
jgi:sugar phosphate isomerase/epimerase